MTQSDQALQDAELPGIPTTPNSLAELAGGTDVAGGDAGLSRTWMPVTIHLLAEAVRTLDSNAIVRVVSVSRQRD